MTADGEGSKRARPKRYRNESSVVGKGGTGNVSLILFYLEFRKKDTTSLDFT